MVLRLALLFVCAVPALADSVMWNITTIAQNGSVVGGYTLSNLFNTGNVGIAPDNNFVAYTSAYTGSTGAGVFGSNGSVIAVKGSVIGGQTLVAIDDSSPLVNDSDTVLFGTTSGFFTASSFLAGSFTNDGNSYETLLPFGLENSGAFLGEFDCCGDDNRYLGDASNVGGLLYTLTSPNLSAQGGQLNNNGEGVYGSMNAAGTEWEIYDLQGDAIAAPGTVIDGDTISSLLAGYDQTAVSINDSGTIAFFAYYNNDSSCGIFTQTSLAVALPHSECGGDTVVNINNNGDIAWYNQGSLYTEDGLVSNQVDGVGNRFFNNLGSLTWISTSGQVELATEVGTSTPEPGTFWLGLGVAVMAGMAVNQQALRAS